MILSLVSLILLLLLVVGVHEAGHALVARWFNVKIEHIAIGFGRPLFHWTSKSGTKWIWGLWPLGGYVRLLNTRISKVPKSQYKYCFDKQSAGAKTMILLAGVSVNLLLAWLAFLLVFLIGINMRPALVASVTPNSMASQAGLQAGDRIESVNGGSIASWQQFGQVVIMGMGRASLNASVKTANGEQKNIVFDLKNWRIKPRDPSLLVALGIHPSDQIEPQRIVADSFPDAVKRASMSCIGLVSYLMITLKQILTGVLPFTLLLGPVGILQMAINSITQGISVFALFIATLSVAVAIVNLLPIPGLDGGSIVYTWIEKIRGKPISIALEVLLYRLAVIFFAVLMVNLLLNDLQRYWGG